MRYSFLFPILGLFLFACTPRATDPVAERKVIPPPEEAEPADTSCVTFSRSVYPDDALNEHVIYRGFLREGDLETAYPHWERAFELAPAADGKRSVQYTDGVRFLKAEFAKTTDSLKKEKIVDRIEKLYADALVCYPDQHFLYGMHAFDLYYSFRAYTSDAEIYDLFVRNIDLDGLQTQAFVLNPFTDILISRYKDGDITMTEAQKYAQTIEDILEAGLARSAEKENFAIVASYVPQRLEEFETVEDFYPPAYYLDKYYPVYVEDSTNCETVQTVYSRLRWGKVDLADRRLQRVESVMTNSCTSEETGSGVAGQALSALREGRYEEAIEGFEAAATNSPDPDKQAQYNLLIAKIYYAHLKNFSQARQYARQAGKLKPNWGPPYILIGKLYASSGPRCGPGRGWDSQIVTWPAIDKWQYAKRIDPTVTDEANKLIWQYQQYMPSVEDIFQRGLKEGQSFTVPCWIRETTTIRAAKS